MLFAISHFLGFFSILAVEDLRCAQVFILVSTAGHVALFPLLYQPAGKSKLTIVMFTPVSIPLFITTELFIKVMLCFIYWAITYISLSYIIRYN